MVFLDKLVNEYADIRFANTNSKRILRILGIGNYVHMSFVQEHNIHSYKLPNIIQHLNRALIIQV